MGLDDGPLLLTAARLWPWKGVDHLISALTQVPDLRLIVAGDGPVRPQLEAQVEQLALQTRVSFLGGISRDMLAVYMKAADYFALYSGYEGLPHSVLESSARRDAGHRQPQRWQPGGGRARFQRPAGPLR